ncbi:hypothetical protein Zmor_004377 [Zophobas morio]|uniref:Uncharacterized protein n=1 Tax=Zophobas morio TaxID=2755281 RepID=A0AA38M0B2_9CUCU|nr:hypothetical protein Zmor_004377 [Zophobas morio]
MEKRITFEDLKVNNENIKELLVDKALVINNKHQELCFVANVAPEVHNLAMKQNFINFMAGDLAPYQETKVEAVNPTELYLLEYKVVLTTENGFEHETHHTFMNKQKLFTSYEKANAFQDQYNKHFADRKIVHYEIKVLSVDIDPTPRGTVDNIG